MERAIGAYRVEREVGRGGVGVVYRARAGDGTTVAIKLLVAGRLANPGQRRRFRLEAEALQRIRHPGVVSLLDQGEHQGAPYLVLEWSDGETLEARLAREGPLDLREAAELVRRLALALQHCHERGVLHRDLKPQNVLLRGRDPLLVDFGLTLVLQSDEGGRPTRTGQLLGTPGWWAPEQAHGERLAIGPPADVYGLGALLHATLTGRAPQEGESLVDVLQALARDPVPPSRLRPEVPPGLDAIALRCLQRDPRQRFPDAAGVGLALGSWLTTSQAAPPRAPRALLPLLLLLPAAGAAAWALIDGLSAASAPAPAPRADSRPAPVTSGAPAPEPGVPELLGSARAALTAGRHDEARRSLEEAAARGSAEALWALYDLEARLDPSLAGDPSPHTRALLEGPPAPPWTDLAALLAASAARDPEAHLEAAALARVHPDLAWAHVLQGTAEGRLGRDPRPALERAIALQPGWGVPRFLIAYAAGNRDDLQAVLEHVERGLEDPTLGPTGRARLLVQRALALGSLGQADRAIETLEQALRHDARLPEALTIHAMMRITRDDAARGDLEVAERALAQLRNIEALPPLALSARATLRERKGDILAALADVEALLRKDPRFPSAERQKAMLLRDLGRWPEGLEAIERHMAAYPRDALGILLRGELKERLGDLRGARQDLLGFERMGGRAAAEAPLDLRARLLMEAGDLARARSELEGALESPGEEHQARLTRGRLLVSAGEVEQALREVDAVLAARPQLREAWSARSECCTRLGDYAAGEVALREADRLAPLRLEERVNLAGIVSDLGRPQEARQLLEQVLRERPDGPRALYNHARACLSLGDHAAALVSAERAMALPAARVPDARFPSTVGWFRVKALCGLGRHPEARAAADALLVDPHLDPALRAEIERDLPGLLGSD